MKIIFVRLASFFKTMERKTIELISAIILSFSVLITLVVWEWGWPSISLMFFVVAVTWICVFREYTWPFIAEYSLIVLCKFKNYPIDLQIAIVLSGISLIALAFASWTAIFWWTFATALAWAIVWREKVTIPAIVWCWNKSQPARDSFFSWLWGILSGKCGLPIAMIGWGAMSLSVYALSLLNIVHLPRDFVIVAGRAGAGGIIFGACGYLIQIFKEDKIKTPPTTP